MTVCVGSHEIESCLRRGIHDGLKSRDLKEESKERNRESELEKTRELSKGRDLGENQTMERLSLIHI